MFISLFYTSDDQNSQNSLHFQFHIQAKFCQLNKKKGCLACLLLLLCSWEYAACRDFETLSSAYFIPGNAQPPSKPCPLCWVWCPGSPLGHIQGQLVSPLGLACPNGLAKRHTNCASQYPLHTQSVYNKTQNLCVGSTKMCLVMT